MHVLTSPHPVLFSTCPKKSYMLRENFHSVLPTVLQQTVWTVQAGIFQVWTVQAGIFHHELLHASESKGM